MKKLTDKSKVTSKLRKLTLRRETVALLTPLQLSGVAGGISGDVCETLVSKTGPCG